VSLLAVFAVGAVASSSASAHEFKVCQEKGAEEYTEHLCSTKAAGGKWSFEPIAAGNSFEVEGTSGVSKLEGEIAGVKVIIECEKDVFTGSIEPAGKTKGKVIFEGCKLYEVKKNVKTLLACTVKNIEFTFTDKLVTGQGPGPAAWGPEDEFNSTEAEETFVKITITGCALESSNKVKQVTVEILPAKQKFAGQVCQLPEAAVGKVEHEISCSSSGSHLEFGGKPAYFFSNEKVKLVNKWAWAAE